MIKGKHFSHFHLLIETPDGNLSLGMRQLNGVNAQAQTIATIKSGAFSMKHERFVVHY